MLGLYAKTGMCHPKGYFFCLKGYFCQEGIFCLKIVQSFGPALWTEVGYGLGVAVEGIYIFI